MSTNEFSHDVATVHTNPNRVFGSLSRSVTTLLDFLTQREAIRVLFNRLFQVKNGTCDTSLDYQALIHLLFVSRRALIRRGSARSSHGAPQWSVAYFPTSARRARSKSLGGHWFKPSRVVVAFDVAHRHGKSAVPRFVSPYFASAPPATRSFWNKLLSLSLQKLVHTHFL